MKEAAAEETALDLVDRLLRGETTAVEAMRGCLRRIEAREKEIRAFAYLASEAAIAAAEKADAAKASGGALGPLHGLPIAVKDIIDTADMPTEFGGEIFAGRRPARDATIVSRLRSAGAIVVGKAMTSQYALFVPGPVRNPHNLAHTPGGSSSGSAAAVAAGFVAVALGTQTNGSIIRPASYCGVVGFKPSLGLLPRTGVLRHSPLLDHPGVFARAVADAAMIVDAIGGEDAEDAFSRSLPGSLLAAAQAEGPPPRLAFTLGPFEDRADPPTRAALAAFLTSLPVEAEEITLGPEFAKAEAAMSDLMRAGVAESLGPDINRAEDRVPERVLQIVAEGRALSAVRLMEAWTRRDALRAAAAGLIAPYDAVLTFASSGPAPLASEGTGDPIFATLWSLIGAPAMSLPLMRAPNGLPLGVQAVAAPGRDLDLTRAAAWLMRPDAR
jgi:Asp-tRNA(Asn)/Glu-tRNA(Gln) amidotransferase A subunit family amidase